MTSLFLVALCAATAIGVPAEPPRIGDRVPNFTAIALDGTTLSLQDAVETHRAVVVLFLSTVCPYANYFGKHLGRLEQDYRRKGIRFIGVNSNQFETVEEMVENAQAHGQEFSLVRDKDATLANRLGASCSPEAYVIDGEGRLRYRGWVLSKQRSPDLKRALDALLNGRPVRPARTKAFGCAIDWPRASYASR